MKNVLILMLLASAFIIGCGKDNEASTAGKPCEVVEKTYQSPHFDKVAGRLDMGGVLFGYMDFTNDLEAGEEYLAELLKMFKDEIPAPVYKSIDVPAISREIGLNNVDAIGLSSIENQGSFVNKMFIYHSGPRTGLMKMGGGDAHEFTIDKLAPKDADLAIEQDINLHALSQAIENIFTAVMGPQGKMMVAMLDTPIPFTSITWRKAIELTDTRISLVVRIDEKKQLALPGPGLTIPHIEVLLGFDKMGVAVDHLNEVLLANPDDDLEFKKGDKWNTMTVTEEIPGELSIYKPVLAKDNKTGALYIATSMKFLEECAGGKAPLQDAAEYKELMKDMPEKGNGKAFISKHLLPKYKRLLSVFGSLDRDAKMGMDIAMKLIPDTTVGTAAVTVNEKDGVYNVSKSFYSHKATVAYLAAMPVTYLGIVAAIAVPAFQKYQRRAAAMNAAPIAY